jgi:L,D-peptidoglycan transpeptidase YkuD (ErfK/YbiS/YcfS/YnhG family)
MLKANPFRAARRAHILGEIVVRRMATHSGAHVARLHAGPLVIRAAIGKTGISHRKREGDGATPVGSFGLAPAFFRPDRLVRMMSAAGARPLKRSMGWCDDTNSGLYNRPIPAAAKQRHERLWREDHVYDVLIPTSHNQRPRVLGAGSAIFLHLARPGFVGTEGCVAISLADMRRLLPRLGRNTRLVVKP